MNKRKIIIIIIAIILIIPLLLSFVASVLAQEEEDVSSQTLASLAINEDRGFGVFMPVRELGYMEFSLGVHRLEVVDVGACANSSVKSYMDYRMVTYRNSPQWRFIQAYMSVDEKTGLLFDQYGFIGVALGSIYGAIGERYLFILEDGTILPVVKIDRKSDRHTNNRCYHISDSSVLEFVIHTQKAGDFFGWGGNGLVVNGNFNNIPEFRGRIADVYHVVYIGERTYGELISNFTLVNVINTRYRKILSD